MLVMVGASASGKTEIAKILINDYRYQKMITYTTRPAREGEINGVDYHFLTEEAFQMQRNNREFLETVEYNGYHYGTAFSDTFGQKVLIVDPKGANVLHEKLNGLAVFFYLETPEAIRADRMKTRGDAEATITERINKDRLRFKRESLNHIDYIVDTAEATLQTLAKTIHDLYMSHKKKTI